MKFLTITLQPTVWLIKAKDHNTVSKQLTIDNILPLTLIKVNAVIQQIQVNFNDFAGGIVDTTLLTNDELLFNDDKKTYSLLQLLTEGLNKPFINAKFLHKNLDNLNEIFAQTADYHSWNLAYFGYTQGKDEYAVESLLTVGNGFIGIRGTLPEMQISDANYPATYIAGLYNSATSKIGNASVVNEDFVNAQNLQYLSVAIDAELIDIETNKLLNLTRELNLKTGLFTANYIIETKTGKQLAITAKRIANMHNVHRFALSYTFTALNFSGKIKVISKADGDVYNYNVARYRSLEQRHLNIINVQANENTALLVTETKQSKFIIVQKSILSSELLTTNKLDNKITDTAVTQALEVDLVANQTYSLEKLIEVFVYSADQQALATQQINTVMQANSFATELQQSAAPWQKLWQKTTINVSGDLMSNKLLHLHTYHLLVSASPTANPSLDVSITARGLHGEAYRGHIFWDELFILPFYITHFPATARQILMYRYNRLTAAKTMAKAAGYKGAMFPWQSGLDGTEQSQALHLNPISGEWSEDHSRLQRHVSLAIAYNVWLYWHNTHDLEYLKKYGAELLLEIAYFWQSIAKYDVTTNRYSISGVMGPDEFHEAYPNQAEGGLKDNAYTNIMVAWLFKQIENLAVILGVTEFQQLLAELKIEADLLAKITDIKNKLHLEIDDNDIIAQYAGYFDLQEINWDYYRNKYGNVYRMDRILSAEGKSANDYKVAKQADALMTFYNLAKHEVDSILVDMGYNLSQDYLAKNLDYYLQRTSHGSTLSRIVHAHLATIAKDSKLSWQLYQEALSSDYHDIQGGTTAEGIHAGVMAATIYVTISSYAGIDIREEILTVKPNLPQQWQAISFNLTIRSINYQFTITQNQVAIMADHDSEINVLAKTYNLINNEKLTINY